MRTSFVFALCASLAACGDNNTTPSADSGAADAPVVDTPIVDAPESDAPESDAPAVDAPAVDAAADAPAVDARPDAPAASCGSARPTVTGTASTEGIVIAADGTIYYSQSGGVGRITPGGVRTASWVRLAGASTVWGLALDAPRRRLYVGSPANGTVYAVDLSTDPPMATPFLTGAGGPNGLTMGPDGLLYYSDFNGSHVYRVDESGMRTRVTTSTITQANGVAFYNGSLYVASYGRGALYRLTLTDGAETARDTVITGLGSLDGLAFDATGAAYVTDQRMGRLVRIAPDGATSENLLTGLSAPANVEFGVGPLSCSDIYIATGRGVVRYEMGSANGLDVPWHR
jgi:sugar lactone lactonase YvrE